MQSICQWTAVDMGAGEVALVDDRGVGSFGVAASPGWSATP
jgi:hypothetical protein